MLFLIFDFLFCNVCCDEQCQSLKGILFVDFEDHAALSDFWGWSIVDSIEILNLFRLILKIKYFLVLLSTGCDFQKISSMLTHSI